MRLAGIVKESIVDGIGIRLTFFTQGCPHHCSGCHNPQTHDFGGGQEYALCDLIPLLDENPLLDGITLSGGEPFSQAAACAALALSARRKGLSVWTYTGYTLDTLLAHADPDQLSLLAATDVLVDGPFIQAQRSLDLQFCGSKNQRLIDMVKTRSTGQVVLWEAL